MTPALAPIPAPGAPLSALLLAHAPAAIALFDRNMCYRAASARWIVDYQLTGQPIIGRSHYEVFPELREAMPHWYDIHQRALAGEVFEQQEDCWRRADGSLEWVQWSIHPTHDAHGAIDGIALFTEVITDRKQSDIALKLSEEILRFTLDYSPIGMAIVGLDGRWLRVNHALSTMLGYSQEELVSIDFQSVTYPQDLEDDIALVEHLLSGEVDSYQMDKRYIRKDGTPLWTQLNVALVRDDDGSPRYFVSQIQNISTRKQQEENQQRLIAKLVETNKELERFAYAASHDLREPVRLVHSYTELLRQEYGPQLDDMGQKYLSICAKASFRMYRLISDLLDYARVDRDSESHERFAVESTLSYVTDMLAANIEARQARITHGALPEITCNKPAFTVLLQNLIGNAIKYGRPDVPPEIHLEAERKDKHWLFCVHDNGLGIKPEYLQQIFEPFTRLHSNAESEGSGMGLAICRKIVDRMGGKLWVESTPGQGSSFCFMLPAHTKS